MAAAGIRCAAPLGHLLGLLSVAASTSTGVSRALRFLEGCRRRRRLPAFDLEARAFGRNVRIVEFRILPAKQFEGRGIGDARARGQKLLLRRSLVLASDVQVEHADLGELLHGWEDWIRRTVLARSRRAHILSHERHDRGGHPQNAGEFFAVVVVLAVVEERHRHLQALADDVA